MNARSEWLSPRPRQVPSERRTETRVTTPVKAWCQGSTFTTYRRVETVDVSEGGVSMISPTPVRTGTTLTVSLSLDSRPVSLSGQVVWSRWEKGQSRFGLAFQTGASSDQQALRNWVHRQSLLRRP